MEASLTKKHEYLFSRYGSITTEVSRMSKKSEKKKKNDNKTTNQKSANPITMETDPKMQKPVRGLTNK